MRLLVVSQYFWPEEFRINDLVEGLVALGHEVTVLTGPPNYPGGRVFPEYRKDPRAFARYGSVEVLRVPVIPRGSRSILLALNYLSFALSGAVIGSWKLRGRRFDAIFVFQTSPVTAAIPALVFRRTKRAPVLMWILDLWPEVLPALGVVRSPRMLALVGAMVRFIYRRCDRILVQSRAFLPNIAKYGRGTARTDYFPNWVEPTFETGLAGIEPAPELAPYRGTFNVMFAGNVGESQGLSSVLDAAEATRDLDQLRWMIVGDGRAMEALRRETAERGLSDRVLFFGRHPVERMPEFFAGAGALLVSLRSEPVFVMTIPGKIQNYLASGKPVLGILDGEGARVIVESQGGLASPAGDGAALAANVRQLVTLDPGEREAMGRAGRSYARESFGRAKLFQALVGWIEEARAEFAATGPRARDRT